MKNDEYVLCVDLFCDGEKKTYPLATLDLKSLEKYTSYCNNENHLVNSVAKSLSNSNSIIGNILKSRFAFNSFSIRTLNKRKTNIKVLFKKDEDVLLSNSRDILKILKKYMITIDDVIENNISKEKEKIIYYINTNFKQFFPSNLEEERRIKKLNPDYYYDKRYEKVQYKWQDLFLFEKNLEDFVNKVFKNYRKWQELGLYLKEITKDKLFNTSYQINMEKSKMTLSYADLRRKELEKTLYFQHKFYDGISTERIILNQILDNLKPLEGEIKKTKNESDLPKKLNKENNLDIKFKNNSIYEKNKENPEFIKLCNNPDFIKYLHRFDYDLEKKVAPLDDYNDEEEYDDWLGPKEPNDPRYWSIN